ncbi:MAG TPA: hypothetical protein VF043_22815 [Ktedonobacteraceae bacterium]
MSVLPQVQRYQNGRLGPGRLLVVAYMIHRFILIVGARLNDPIA